MAGTKISALSSLSALADASILPVVDSGTNYKLTGTSLATYTTSKIPTASSSTPGLVKIDGSTITLNGSNQLVASTGAAAAGTLTGNTLASGVLTSSLTTVGTLGSLTVTGLSLLGSGASATNWPNTKLISTQSLTSHSHTYNMGIVGEAVADATDAAKWGIGVYGRGNTNGAQRSGGVMGDGGVTNTADTGSAIGVRGYADDTHAGGFNIGLYGSASNGATNYALYMNAGGIYSGAAQTWALNGNLTFSGAYSVTIPTASTNTITVKDVRDTVYTPGGSAIGNGNWGPDAANGDIQQFTLASGVLTFTGFANAATGQSVTFILTQPSSGAAATWATSGITILYAGAAKVLSTANSAVDMIVLTYVGSSTYYASFITGFTA